MSMSALFTGVPECFLVYTEYRGVTALFSAVSRISRYVRLVYWCVQSVS